MSLGKFYFNLSNSISKLRKCYVKNMFVSISFIIIFEIFNTYLNQLAWVENKMRCLMMSRELLEPKYGCTICYQLPIRFPWHKWLCQHLSQLLSYGSLSSKSQLQPEHCTGSTSIVTCTDSVRSFHIAILITCQGAACQCFFNFDLHLEN